MMSENRMPRKITGRKRDEETGEWGNLHNEKLYNMCSSTKLFG
jgi:hypothetical protein